MKKKLFVILFTCILCATTVAACGNNAGSEAPSQTAETAITETEAESPAQTTEKELPDTETETASPEAAQADDPEIIETVLSEFKLLAKVPRPSHHEKKISDFLVNWAKEQGFSPVQDEVYNMMFDVPASEGFEALPLCILQGHMDMVVAVEDGKDFDPLSDPITIIRDEKTNTLTADGTSLGADDGIGVSIIMAIAEGKMKHGPLRMLITADEEDGMEGTFHLDKSWLDGADFLINIDYEVSDCVLVSTASGDAVKVSKQEELQDPSGDTALNISLTGLKGGHSGVQIDKGRMNGLIGLASFLKELEGEGIGFELADFSGGTAGNAIPTKATCTIVISAKDQAAVEELADGYLDSIPKVWNLMEEILVQLKK